MLNVVVTLQNGRTRYSVSHRMRLYLWWELTGRLISGMSPVCRQCEPPQQRGSSTPLYKHIV